jgi:hypothetical protein
MVKASTWARWLRSVKISRGSFSFAISDGFRNFEGSLNNSARLSWNLEATMRLAPDAVLVGGREVADAIEAMVGDVSGVLEIRIVFVRIVEGREWYVGRKWDRSSITRAGS